jgi:hypothetical protein
MQIIRCPACGLTQLLQGACKRCGAALTAPPTPSRPVLREPRPPSRMGPYLTIWTSPRQTIRAIVDSDPTRGVILLAWLGGGIAELASNLLFKSKEDYPWVFFATICVMSGPLAGFLVVYLDGLLFSWVGRWLGGGADAQECRAAVAWSLVPQIATLALWIPVVALLGDEAFLKETPRFDRSPPLQLALLPLGVAWVVAFVWSYVLRWKCLGEVHGFSAWRGFLTTLIAGAAWLALVVGVALVLLAHRQKNPSSSTERAAAATPSVCSLTG